MEFTAELCIMEENNGKHSWGSAILAYWGLRFWARTRRKTEIIEKQR